MGTNTLKLASLTLAAYALILVLDSVVYARFVGAPTLWDRVLVYVPLVLLLAWGLWHAKRWAWIGSVIFTAVFGMLGGLGLWAGISSGAWRTRPYPILDLLISTTMTVLFLIALVLLFLPSTKRVLHQEKA